jgi:hypothetical protein
VIKIVPHGAAFKTRAQLRPCSGVRGIIGTDLDDLAVLDVRLELATAATVGVAGNGNDACTAIRNAAGKYLLKRKRAENFADSNTPASSAREF